ncbi:MAG: PrsW family glutamic-type intramembrane protease [Rudaea sp.]
MTTNTLVASFTAIVLVYGALLLLSALPALRGQPWPRVRLAPVWVWVVLFVIVISLGQLVLSTRFAAPYLFPPWHVLAAGLVPLAVLAYASKRLPGASLPSLVAEISWGGLGTIFTAVVFELIVGILFLLLGSIAIALVLGPDRLQELALRLQPVLEGSTDPSSLIDIVSGQPGLVLVALLLILLFFSGAVPLIEELLKGLGPAIAIGRARPTASRALLWGLAAGAGYAFSENLLNGSQGASVQTGTGSVLWAPLIALRAGTSLVHMAATATVTMGWWNALVRGRRSLLVVFLMAAVAAHGFWNLVALIMGSALGTTQLGGGGGSGPGLLILVSATAVLLLLLLAAAAWLVWLVRLAARQDHRDAGSPGDTRTEG